MKRICILTATRAEYSLLKPLIVKLSEEKQFEIFTVVTGMHLSTEFGLTYKEIEKDNIPINRKIPILLSSDSPASVSKAMGLALIEFSSYFEEIRPDILIVLGDRYETISVCLAAMNEKIPIVHIHGGEKTEGVIDEAIRHSITKMSVLHFTSTEEYRKRVIQLGEQPNSVFNVGALGVENIKNLPLLSKEALEKEINFKFNKNVIMVTYHPVTLEDETASQQFEEILSAIDEVDDIKIIFTKANSDAGGREINQMIDEYVEQHLEDSIAFTSMGQIKYFSALKYSCLVLGNSSSGIIEAPSFGISTINVGNRQLGRIQAASVINCGVNKVQIKQAIIKALSKKTQEEVKKVFNPYEGKNTSQIIVEHIKNYLKTEKNIQKIFYDI